MLRTNPGSSEAYSYGSTMSSRAGKDCIVDRPKVSCMTLCLAVTGVESLPRLVIKAKPFLEIQFSFVGERWTSLVTSMSLLN